MLFFGLPTMYGIVSDLLKKKNNSSVANQATEEIPFANLKKLKNSTLNFIQADEIPEGASPTITKSINNSPVTEKSTSGSLFGSAQAGTGEASLKAGISTTQIIIIAACLVGAIILIPMIGGKK